MDLHTTRNVTPAQLRAARGLLDCSIEEIASVSNMSREALSKIERGHSRPQRGTMDTLIATFESRGVVFTDDDGVRKRSDLFTLIEGTDAYLRVLDDTFLTLKGTRGEVLFFYVDNSKSSQAVIDSSLRMRHDGIHFRSLINEENPYCLYPLTEYRCIPRAHFHNNPIIVYQDKVAVMVETSIVQDTSKLACLLTRNASYADAMRRMFDALWFTHHLPKNNLADITYD